MEIKKLIYVCSPYGGKHENYIAALEYMRYVFEQGAIPIASHVLYHNVLNDDNDTERFKGMSAGLKIVALCDELWVFGSDITNGMRIEINFANNLGKTVKEVGAV